MVVPRLSLLLFVLTLGCVTFADEGSNAVWDITSNIGRTVYLSDLYVRKAKCGRRILTGNYRIQVTLERDHFRGNTATRGWATSAPSKELKFPLALVIDMQREDQTRTALRWTLEARNGSWATWTRLFRSEVMMSQLLEEDTDKYCMIMFPKVLPYSKTYRKDPCDHVLCMTLHHAGSDNYPPESWLDSTPMEAIIAVTLLGCVVIWVVSGWVKKARWGKLVRLLYFAPLGLLGFLVYYRLQGIQTVTEGKVILHDVHWGYGEGLSYGTDADQEYQFVATFQFQGHSTTYTSPTITGLAATRNPEQISWPQVLSWPLPAEPTTAHTAVTMRVLVTADGKPVDSEYTLTFDAATKLEDPPLCARTTDAPQPQFCLKYFMVAPQEGPSVSWIERLPGFGILGYGAIGFILLVVFRRRKPREGDDSKDEGEEDDEDTPSAKKRK